MVDTKSCCNSKEDKMPATTIVGATSEARFKTAATLSSGHEDELIRIRADMVCIGCRCGWLCCDCVEGCLACKQRRRYCYCRLATLGNSGGVYRVQCEICTEMLRSCQCQLTYRCKWCTVSLEKCKRGGCVSLLPDRLSPEAKPYVDIFNMEERSDEEDRSVEETQDDETDKRSLTSTSSQSMSLLSWSSSSLAPSTSRVASTWSVESAAQAEWWHNQQVHYSNKMYGSTSTLSSVTSGGSFGSVGGKSEF